MADAFRGVLFDLGIPMMNLSDSELRADKRIKKKRIEGNFDLSPGCNFEIWCRGRSLKSSMYSSNRLPSSKMIVSGSLCNTEQVPQSLILRNQPVPSRPNSFLIAVVCLRTLSGLSWSAYSFICRKSLVFTCIV